MPPNIDDELEALGVTPGYRSAVEDPAGDPTTRASAPRLPAEHQALPGGRSLIASPPVRLGNDIAFVGGATKQRTCELAAGSHPSRAPAVLTSAACVHRAHNDRRH